METTGSSGTLSTAGEHQRETQMGSLRTHTAVLRIRNHFPLNYKNGD